MIFTGATRRTPRYSAIASAIFLATRPIAFSASRSAVRWVYSRFAVEREPMVRPLAVFSGLKEGLRQLAL